MAADAAARRHVPLLLGQPADEQRGNAAGAWRRLNRLRVRIAVSEAAAWTGRRFYGGRYRVIPNGVHVDADLAGAEAAAPPG